MIVEELGGLPLAVVQAGSYLATVKISPKEYLQLYKTQKVRLLKSRPPMSVWNYQYSVFSTWETSFAVLNKNHPVAARLLQICSFLNAQSVPYAMLSAASQPGGRRAEIWNGLWERSIKTLVAGRLRRRFSRGGHGRYDMSDWGLLSPIPTVHQLFSEEFGLEHGLQAILELSLASENKSRDGLVIHPLVQTWCRNRENRERSPHQFRIPEEALLCVARAIDHSGAQHSLWLQATLHLPNCLTVLSNLEAHRQRRKLDINILHAIDVVGRTLTATKSAGQESAFALLYNALLRARGPGHGLTLATLQRLATAMEGTSFPERAEEYHRRAFQGSARYLGKTHADTVTAGQNLGANLLLQRKWSGAKALLSPIHKHRASQNPSALPTLQTQCNLALCAAGLGRAREAEVLIQDILHKVSTAASTDDEDFLLLGCLARGNLALVYCLDKRWDEAEKVLLASMAHAEEHFGQSHPFTIAQLLSLDGFYRGSNPEIMELPLSPLQLGKSMATQAKAIRIWDHLDLETQSGFAHQSFDLYYAVGDLDSAEAMLDRFEDALIRGGERGSEFVRVAEAEIALGRGLAQWDRGLLPEAIASWSDAVHRYEALLPQREGDLAVAVTNLGVAYRDAGELGQARTHLARARGLQSQRREDTLRIDTHLATVHMAAGELVEAQRLLGETQAEMDRCLPPGERFNLLNRYAMDCLHEAKGNVEEAICGARRTLDAKVLGMGLEHSATIKTALMLARLYRGAGRHEEARKVAERIRPYEKYW